jgi:hypothetical protein
MANKITIHSFVCYSISLLLPVQVFMDHSSTVSLSSQVTVEKDQYIQDDVSRQSTLRNCAKFHIRQQQRKKSLPTSYKVRRMKAI